MRNGRVTETPRCTTVFIRLRISRDHYVIGRQLRPMRSTAAGAIPASHDSPAAAAAVIKCNNIRNHEDTDQAICTDISNSPVVDVGYSIRPLFVACSRVRCHLYYSGPQNGVQGLISSEQCHSQACLVWEV